MLIKALLVGIVGIICILDSRLLGRLNLERPLIVSTLTGLVLGNVEQGLAIGAALELMSMGLVSIGAANPPDMNLGSIIATAFAILTGATNEVALTIAMPIAILGQMIGIVMRTILASLTHKADAYIDAGEFGKAKSLHIVVGPILYSLMYFIPIFLAIYFGTEYVKMLIEFIPEWLTNGLGLASKILPAYGFALLLTTMVSKKTIPFFFLGFIIAAYSGLGVTPIALFAVVFAFILYELRPTQTQDVDSLD